MKEKSHRGIAKRVKVTATGRVFASRVGYQHKRLKKRASQKRAARKGMELVGGERKKIKRLLSA
ncbi:MAG: 50S ribosomal protein L35 [Candidatus Acetothermia bacterium]|jgi:large subunit ribosomal protein L35|nr:50S ribosomal protein L35 [Candidatus Acetothermia bacterium]MDH7506055.1 bL35 family ribosomal protein [Candidatus Acetothermia bacterium]